MDLLTSPKALLRWAWASLIANMAIIVTGGLVRVTGSGLGCSTWPQCEPGAYLPHPEAGLHAFIEFGNRTLTFALVAIAVATFFSARLSRPAGSREREVAVRLSVAIGIGIIAQAVIGGISVLTNLNPWVVGAHLLPSIALVVLCVVLIHVAQGREPLAITVGLRSMVWTLFGLGMLAMVLGAVVTGAGPNSGDGGAQRNGLDLRVTAQLHAWSVWALLALTVATIVLAKAHPQLRRAALWVLATELLQGVIGYTQYFLALPPALVAAHMAGTTLFTAALAHLWWSARRDVTSAAQSRRATAV